MKRLIITDSDGKIIATGPHPDDEDSSSNGRFGMLPLDGQTVHEVELPDHMTTAEHIHRLHQSYGVEVSDGVAKLVERRTGG